MEVSVDQFKSGSSLTLGKYNTKLTEMLPPRSAKLLGLRGPAFPAQALDLSAELAQENGVRRSMHRTILERDPAAFRKKERAESASSAVHQRQQVKDLLGDMHQLKDFRDIDKSKKFTRSILFEQEQQKSMTLKEYQFQHLKPIDDFVRPDDQLSPRMTGYEHGHIRSLLKLDVYGPAASVTIERERDTGVLPRSPNVDRHQVLNPHHTLAISRPGTSQSVASSRASTAGSTSYNGAFPSLKVLRKQHDQSIDSLRKSGHRDHPDRSISPTFAASTDISHSLSNNNVLDQARANSRQGSRGRSSQGHNHHQHGHNDGGLSLNRNATDNYVMNTSGVQVDFAGPGLRPMTGSSVGTGVRSNSRPVSVAGHSTARSRSGKYPEQTFPGVAITEEERLLGGDPFLRRTTWYKQFATSKKLDAESREVYKQEQRRVKQQQKLAEEERQRMKDFDDYLVLAKYNP